MVRVYSPTRWSWLSMIGPDAEDFLHRLTTVHVRALAPGQGAPGCFLTAQGKIRSYFRLWRYGEEEFGFELDGGPEGALKAALLAVIDQYTFAEKIVVADVSALETRWLFPQDPHAFLTLLGAPQLVEVHSLALDDELRLCHHGERDFGRPWISAWGRPARLEQWIDRLASPTETVPLATVDGWRVAALGAAYPREINESVIPLEAGLVEAIADQKGCYPGQEVIERIVALGSPARRLCLIEGQGAAPIVGAKVLNQATPPVEIGEVTSVSAMEAGRFQTLAFIRKIHAKEGFDVGFESQARGKIARIAPYSTRPPEIPADPA